MNKSFSYLRTQGSLQHQTQSYTIINSTEEAFEQLKVVVEENYSKISPMVTKNYSKFRTLHSMG